MAIDFQEDGNNGIDFQLDFQEDEPSGLENMAKAAGTFGKNFVGGVDAALSMAAGAVPFIGSGLAGLGTAALTGDMEAGEAVRQDLMNSGLGLGAPKPLTKEGEEVSGMLEHGIKAGAERLGDIYGPMVADFTPDDPNSENVVRGLAEGGFETAMNFLPIPGAKGVRKLGGKIEEGLFGDPAKTSKNQKALDALNRKEPVLNKEPTQINDKLRWLQDRQVEASRAAMEEAFAKSHDQFIQENLQRIDDASNRMEDRLAMQANETLAQKLSERETNRGQEPIYVDPQGQAFRGDPASPDARLGLERQTQAMDRELTHLAGKETPTGEPLRPLRDVERADAMQAARDTRIAEMDGLKPAAPKGLAGRAMSSKGKMGRQRGAINPEVFKEGFEKIKALMDGSYLRASTKGGFLTIEAIKDGERLGSVIYDRTNKFDSPMEQNLVAPMVGVEKAARGKGLATKMYKFAAELGNDIVKSRMTTDAGKKMWQGFEERGVAKDGRIQGDHLIRTRTASAAEKNLKALLSADAKTHIGALAGHPIPPKGQRGSVTTDLLTLGLLPKKNPVAKMVKQKDGTFIPDDPTPEQLGQLMEKARNEQDGSSFKYMDSGAQLTASKRKSTAIKVVGDAIGNAFKRADLAIRNSVFPAEAALKSLSMNEMRILGEVFKKEMFNGDRVSRKQLEMFTPEIQTAYRKMREMFDESLRIQNEARAAKGQDPITPVEAYLSSRWVGDFRRPLYDKNGKLMWYLASETKMGLDAQTRAVLKDFPELTFDPKKDHTVRFYNRKTDLESAYTTMIDILGRDDPTVAKLQQYMEDQTVGRGASFLAQEKHFKAKGNVRGFVGDRPELTLNDFVDRTIPFGDKITVSNSPKSEILAMMQQQIQYAKNGIRWAELQKVGDTVKTIINDPHLVEHQPKNIEYIRQYWKHSIGYGESRFTRAMADSIRDFGVSPAPFDRGVGGLKSFFILDKLAANAGYVLAQGVQLSMILPHMIDAAVKGGFVSNPLKAVASGLLGGLTMGSGHMFNSLTGKARFEGIPGAEFFNRAYKYAEENGITARSIYDESPIQSSFSTIGKIGKAAGKTLTVPETYIRSMAFMTLAQFLKDSGKFKNELDVFKEAERRTNIAMVDYAATERPMIFDKLGSTGNFLNTLQTYSWNFFNQYSYFVREASHGNVMPLMTALAVQYLVAGANGIPGFEDAYKLMMNLKDALPAKYWKQVQENEFLREPKLWLLKHAGTSSVYGYLSDKSGIGLTSRVAAPSGGQMLTSPAGPVSEVYRQGKSALNAVVNPNQTTIAQAAMDLTPPGVQGLLETAPFMEGITHNSRPDGTKTYVRPTKLAEREGLVNRTPEDEKLRKFGLRSTKEVIERDVNYANKRDSVAAREKTKSTLDKFYDALRRGDKEDAAEYYKTYVFITGKGITQEQLNSQIEMEVMTDAERATKNAKSNLINMINAKRSKEIFDQIKKENP